MSAYDRKRPSPSDTVLRRIRTGFDPAIAAHSRLLHGLWAEPEPHQLLRCVYDPRLLFEREFRDWFVAFTYQQVQSQMFKADYELAQELFQDCFLRLMQAARPRSPKFELRSSSPITFLKGVIRKNFLQSCKKLQSGKHRCASHLSIPLDEFPAPAARSDNSDERRQLAWAISQLRLKDQEFLRLMIEEQRSIKEIARLEGTSENALQLRRHRIYRRLQKLVLTLSGRVSRQS